MVALPIKCPKCGAQNYYYSTCKTCGDKKMADKTFWVIETARTTYWDGRKTGKDAHFTESIGDAIKFADEASAEVPRVWLLEGLDGGAPRLRSVEHAYMDSTHA